MSDFARPHRRQPTRLPCPWDSPGKNTGVGCHFLLQCMKVKSESEVAQSCPTQRPHGLQPTRLLRPWDLPGKSTGVGCHCFLHTKSYFTLNILWYSVNITFICSGKSKYSCRSFTEPIFALFWWSGTEPAVSQSYAWMWNLLLLKISDKKGNPFWLYHILMFVSCIFLNKDTMWTM